MGSDVLYSNILQMTFNIRSNSIEAAFCQYNFTSNEVSVFTDPCLASAVLSPAL